MTRPARPILRAASVSRSPQAEGFTDASMVKVRLQAVQFSWICPPGAFDEKAVVSLQDMAALPIIEQDAGSGLTAPRNLQPRRRGAG